MGSFSFLRKHFWCFPINVKLQLAFALKLHFISETDSLCQFPFGPSPQISKPRFGRGEQYFCFLLATPRTAWLGRTVVLFSLPCLCFDSFPQILFIFSLFLILLFLDHLSTHLNTYSLNEFCIRLNFFRTKVAVGKSLRDIRLVDGGLKLFDLMKIRST